MATEYYLGNIKGPKGDKGEKGDTGEQGLPGADYQAPAGGIPKSDLSAAVQASLNKADAALQAETDPTVPAWAKAASKPTYTASEVGAEPAFTKNTGFNKNFGTAAGTVCEGNDTRLSNSRPASDVSAWAKAASKPTYTASEVGAEPAFTKNGAFNKDFGSAAGTVCEGNDSRLSNARPASDVSGWAKAASKPTYTASEVGALPITGGAVTGAMTVVAPTADTNPATKKYVDDKIAEATTGVSGVKGNAESTYRTGNVNLTAANIGAEPAFSKNAAFNKNFGTATGTVCEGDDTRLSNSRPASDVSAWAKAASKPAYTASEVGAEPAFTKNTGFNKNFGTATGTVCEGNDTRLSNARTPTAHTHGNADLSELGAWAKAASKPTYTASEVGAEPAFTKNGAFNKNFGTAASTVCEGNDTRLSNSRPASDVSAWAKAASKPTYTASEVGAEPAFTKNTGFNKNFGTAAGTVCEGNDARLNSLANIVNLIYPIGSILTIEDANFNPNSQYTGTTWIELKDHVLYARSSGDANLQTVGVTGGSNDAAVISHTHTIGSHTHTSAAHSHGWSGSTPSGGGHRHEITGGNYNDDLHTFHLRLRSVNQQTYNSAGGYYQPQQNLEYETVGWKATSKWSDHSHTVNGTVDSATPGATGATTPTCNTVGEAATRRNMMKYRVVVMWKRTA